MARVSRAPLQKKDPETRQEAVLRRLAELAAQRDWLLVEAGRSLHDDLGQVLTASGIQFDLMVQELRKSAPAVAQRLATLQGYLEECQARTRIISGQLNTSTVDRLGLKSALNRLRDRREDAFAGYLSLEYSPSARYKPSASRAVYALMDHALHIACNRLSCTRAELSVEEFEATAFLENVFDPFQDVEDEVRWHQVRGAANIAGGDAEMDVASGSGKGTILRVLFG